MRSAFKLVFPILLVFPALSFSQLAINEAALRFQNILSKNKITFENSVSIGKLVYFINSKGSLVAISQNNAQIIKLGLSNIAEIYKYRNGKLLAVDNDMKVHILKGQTAKITAATEKSFHHATGSLSATVDENIFFIDDNGKLVQFDLQSSEIKDIGIKGIIGIGAYDSKVLSGNLVFINKQGKIGFYNPYEQTTSYVPDKWIETAAAGNFFVDPKANLMSFNRATGKISDMEFSNVRRLYSYQGMLFMLNNKFELFTISTVSRDHAGVLSTYTSIELLANNVYDLIPLLDDLLLYRNDGTIWTHRMNPARTISEAADITFLFTGMQYVTAIEIVEDTSGGVWDAIIYFSGKEALRYSLEGKAEIEAFLADPTNLSLARTLNNLYYIDPDNVLMVKDLITGKVETTGQLGVYSILYFKDYIFCLHTDGSLYYRSLFEDEAWVFFRNGVEYIARTEDDLTLLADGGKLLTIPTGSEQTILSRHFDPDKFLVDTGINKIQSIRQVTTVADKFDVRVIPEKISPIKGIGIHRVSSLNTDTTVQLHPPASRTEFMFSDVGLLRLGASDPANTMMAQTLGSYYFINHANNLLRINPDQTKVDQLKTINNTFRDTNLHFKAITNYGNILLLLDSEGFLYGYNGELHSIDNTRTFKDIVMVDRGVLLQTSAGETKIMFLEDWTTLAEQMKVVGPRQITAPMHFTGIKNVAALLPYTNDAGEPDAFILYETNSRQFSFNAFEIKPADFDHKFKKTFSAISKQFAVVGKKAKVVQVRRIFLEKKPGELYVTARLGYGRGLFRRKAPGVISFPATNTSISQEIPDGAFPPGITEDCRLLFQNLFR